jgi:hypothetical membrane protein
MARTRGLLWLGAAGAISFVVVFLINDAVRPNYDPVRDFVSEAAIGAGGWVQIANFIFTGCLLVFASAALSATAGRWTGILVALVGVSLVAAGVFVSDPAPRDRATWHGIAHNVASVVVFASLSAACFVAARWRSTPSWRWYSGATGFALPIMFVTAGADANTSGLWQRLIIVAGWSWLAVLSLRALRSPASVDDRAAHVHSGTEAH